jgi:hypothetical protein
MQPADKIVTPATERIHVAAPRTRHLARIPEFKKYAPPDPVRFRPKPSFDSGDLNGSSCPTADLVTEFKIEWNRRGSDHQVRGMRRQLR